MSVNFVIKFPNGIKFEQILNQFPTVQKCDYDLFRIRICLFFQILQQTNFSNHRQSMEWIGNVGKIANVADTTSVMRPDTLYFGTVYLNFKYI